MAEVVFRNVTKVYQPGNVRAVTDFSLTVRDREFMVLVGPSGCGKSTALRMLAGLEEITSGDLLIDGVRVNDTPPRDRDIAMVFQNYALYPHMSVYENMAFGLKLRRVARREIDERVHEAAAILGLSEILTRKPKALSGGQRQRVAVGRAIVRKPKVFLFDEPLSNLDAKMRVQMRAELRQLHSRLHATMVYVTHDQVEAMTMGDRITVMKAGAIHQVDEPMTIYNAPADTFVAGFIGSPPMNLFPARVSDGAVVLKGQRLLISAECASKIASAGLDAVTVGIRPQDFAPQSTGQGSAMEATVALVEPLGAESYLHCVAGDAKFVAMADPRTRIHPGNAISLGIRADSVKLFHPATGTAL